MTARGYFGDLTGPKLGYFVRLRAAILESTPGENNSSARHISGVKEPASAMMPGMFLMELARFRCGTEGRESRSSDAYAAFTDS